MIYFYIQFEILEKSTIKRKAQKKMGDGKENMCWVGLCRIMHSKKWAKPNFGDYKKKWKMAKRRTKNKQIIIPNRKIA